MKKLLCLMLCTLLLTGCGSNTITEVTAEPTLPPEAAAAQPPTAPAQRFAAPDYVSRFDAVTEIQLSDGSITVDGGGETDTVYVSHDIVYYEDRDTYDSGNPYGEGADADKHSAEEAAAHTVVNITAPGAYRVSGKLSAGQIRVDLGEDADADPNAVVELILDNADITCTVAPAILFLNTYECDGSWSTETAKPDVDTSAAGANLILEGENSVNGAYVARIFKDQEEEKKLWKQDGAIYSYQSMNVFGPGSLILTAENEGLDAELHLTINGGDIQIFSDNDGINTNEDGVSVTTINGGNLTIFAGLGAEGDGVDSNGYLVINGGTVIASANPRSDAGLDSDLGSYIHGGSVTAFGSAMDWAESDSGQVTMNLQFASEQPAGSRISITTEDGTEICGIEIGSEYARSFSGLILSRPEFTQGATYHVFVDGVQMAYTGTDVRQGPGGQGRGSRPDGSEPGQTPKDFNRENLPDDFDPAQRDGDRGPRPDGEPGTPPDGLDGERPAMPEGVEPPEGGFGGRGLDDRQGAAQGDPSTEFYMNDMVNFFSGLTQA